MSSDDAHDAHYALMRDRLPRVARSLALRDYAMLTASDPHTTVTLHLTADECLQLAAQLEDVAAQLRRARGAA